MAFQQRDEVVFGDWRLAIVELADCTELRAAEGDRDRVVSGGPKTLGVASNESHRWALCLATLQAFSNQARLPPVEEFS